MNISPSSPPASSSKTTVTPFDRSGNVAATDFGLPTDINMDTTLTAINVLYKSGDPASKEKASSYLNQIQASIYGWKIADELLLAKLDVESCYFAAHTLRVKIQGSYNELDDDSYISLKNSIINHLKAINSTVIQTQLALSLTYLAILVPGWANPVEELVQKDLSPVVLVEILTILPEELEQRRQTHLRGIGASRRRDLTHHLASIAPQVICLLSEFLRQAQGQMITPSPNTSSESPAEKLVSKIYRCISPWLKLVYVDQKEPENVLCLMEHILSSIFVSLKDLNCCDSIHDAAADMVCEAAIACEEYQTHSQLVHYLLNQIVNLEVVYHQSVTSEDLDKSINYARIFTEMAESVIEPLIIDAAVESGQQIGFKLVDLILSCVGHYDYEVAQITFHFWYRFSELIHKKGGVLMEIFAPVTNRLIMSLTKHCELESDQEGLLGLESDLHEFRLRVRDLIKEMIFIVGASNFLKQNSIITNLKALLMQMVASPMQSIPNWYDVEAQLHTVSCLIRELNEDNEVINLVIDMILITKQQSHLHPQVLATCCVVFGELSDWLEFNPSQLDAVLGYLLSVITNLNPKLGSALPSVAASCLQPIISSCAEKHLVSNWNLINILIQICCQLDFVAINNENAAHNLLVCCSTIISQYNHNNRSNQEEMIIQLLTPHTNKLIEILSQNSQTSSKLDPVIYLDRIASVFRNLKLISSENQANPNSPLNSYMKEQFWPILENILNTNSASVSDDKIIERSCRCLRYIIRCLKPVWLLTQIANTVVNLYQLHPRHSSYLYMGSILVDEFGSREDLIILGVGDSFQQDEIINGLIQMLNAYCLPTFKLLNGLQLRQQPDTIDDFFRLCNRFLQKCPEKFLFDSMLDSILALNIASLELDHKEANNTVVKFLLEFIEVAKSDQKPAALKVKINHILNQDFGQRIVDTVMNSSLFTLPSYFVPDMADILWFLISWNREAVKVWLRVTLEKIPREQKAGVVAITPEQLMEFYDRVSEATHPKTVASSLRTLSRLYR